MNGFLIGAILGLIVLAYAFRGFTTVEEGFAKAIMCFRKCVKIVGIPPEDKVIDSNWNVIDPPENAKKKRTGLFFLWVPFLFSVHRYKFSWTSLEQNGEVRENNDVLLDHILLKRYVYLVVLEGAETSEKLPLDIKLLLKIQIVNPYKALFGVEDWLRATTNEVGVAVRSVTATKTYEETLQKKEEMKQELDVILSSSNIDENLLQNYGVNLESIGFHDIALSGELAQKFVEASTKRYLAEMEKEAVIVTADAEVARLEKILSKMKEHGEMARLLRTLEAIEKAASGQGNTIVIPAEFTQFLQALRGGDKS